MDENSKILIRKNGPLSPTGEKPKTADKDVKKLPETGDKGDGTQVINYETFESSSDEEQSRCIFES